MQPLHALILGIVEGVTEFRPSSSTGHLILVSQMLGLAGESVKTFEIVIQSGAIAAVLILYRQRIAQSFPWLASRLTVSFLPAAVIGVLLHKWIKENLFGTAPVVTALWVGGIAMIFLDRWVGRKRPSATLETLNFQQAFWIGLAQCLAFWPGTSRSMVTLGAGMLLGLSPAAAAEYSFLLAVPTLGAAAAFDLLHGFSAFFNDIGAVSLAVGFVSSAGIAVWVMRKFVQWITSKGLSPFAYYRIALAGVLMVSGCATAMPNDGGVRFGMTREQALKALDGESPIISQSNDTVVTTATADDGRPCMRVLKFEKNRLAKIEDMY